MLQQKQHKDKSRLWKLSLKNLHHLRRIKSFAVECLLAPQRMACIKQNTGCHQIQAVLRQFGSGVA